MELPSYFNDFLSNIKLPDSLTEECKKSNQELREQLYNDEDLAPIIVNTFLQGSYRRGTIVRPLGKEKVDVDLVLVTKLSKEEYTPDQVFAVFTQFLEEHYKGRHKQQGRSIGISLNDIDLDMVVTAAPSESQIGILKSESVGTLESLDKLSDWRLNRHWPEPLPSRVSKMSTTEEWKSEPLYIPDREAKVWEPTHPLAQIQWTRDKNGRCNGHYLGVVKAIKWWHKQQTAKPKYPKGYLIEHIVGYCCPDSIRSVAEGVTLTLEEIKSSFLQDVQLGRVPYLPDHGVPENDVFKRVSAEEFKTFYGMVAAAAVLAREAYDEADLQTSANKWKKLFVNDFPDPPDNGDDRGGKGPDKGEFTRRTAPAVLAPGRFA
jgi:hypothetical protein